MDCFQEKRNGYETVSRTKRDPLQKPKESIIQLDEATAERLYNWLVAVRDVKLEMSRQSAVKEKKKDEQGN